MTPRFFEKDQIITKKVYGRAVITVLIPWIVSVSNGRSYVLFARRHAHSRESFGANPVRR